jgi:hypothetical protein
MQLDWAPCNEVDLTGLTLTQCGISVYLGAGFSKDLETFLEYFGEAQVYVEYGVDEDVERKARLGEIELEYRPDQVLPFTLGKVISLTATQIYQIRKILKGEQYVGKITF